MDNNGVNNKVHKLKTAGFIANTKSYIIGKRGAIIREELTCGPHHKRSPNGTKYEKITYAASLADTASYVFKEGGEIIRKELTCGPYHKPSPDGTTCVKMTYAEVLKVGEKETS